jgi:hypothetical protein
MWSFEWWLLLQCFVITCLLSGFICSCSKINDFGIDFKVSSILYHGRYGNLLSTILVSRWCKREFQLSFEIDQVALLHWTTFGTCQTFRLKYVLGGEYNLSIHFICNDLEMLLLQWRLHFMSILILADIKSFSHLKAFIPKKISN